jgi:hypothetical protein
MEEIFVHSVKVLCASVAVEIERVFTVKVKVK